MNVRKVHSFFFFQLVCGFLLVNSSTKPSASLIHHVNPYIGTSYHEEQRWDVHDYGNCNMPIGPPFAHTPWTAQTRANENKCTSPYYYFDDYWHGMRRTHWMSGSCTIDYGSATIVPAMTPSLLSALKLHAMNHSAEVVTPSYYSMNLSESLLFVEAASASRSGILRVTTTMHFDHDSENINDDDDHSFFLLFTAFDSRHNKSSIKLIPSTLFPGCVDEIIVANPVHRWYQSKGEYAHFLGYHYFKISQPICDFGMIEPLSGGQAEYVHSRTLSATSTIHGPVAAYLKISRNNVELLESGIHVYTGASFLSPEKARLNMLAELSSYATEEEAQREAFVSLEILRDRTNVEWDNKLTKIRVVPHRAYEDYTSDNTTTTAPADSHSQAQLTTFYSALWRSLLLPRIVSDFDGEYLTFGDAERRIVSTSDDHFDRYYDDYSMWDVYRAQVPLFHLIYPEDSQDMIVSLLMKARAGGWLPIFPAWHSYTDEMIGDHCTVMIADAFLKGIIPLNPYNEEMFNELVQYMLKNALTVSPTREYTMGMGRRALDSYLKYGFIPLEDEVLDSAHPRQQVSRTLEYAYDDYVVAQSLRLYIDFHQYKNKWYQNRTRHDDNISTSKCAINNVDNVECQIFPVVHEEELNKARKALRQLEKSSENFLWLIDGHGASGIKHSVSSGKRCASNDVDTESDRGGNDEEDDDDEHHPTGFPRPRHANFSWVNFDSTSPFDPTRYYTWLTETTVWQYTFSVPHNVEGMIRAYGGESMFLEKLDEFFEQGHYNHGNEPDHHVLFLYAYVPGAVWKIQHYLPMIIMKEYGHTERGLAGNEDAGQMSAWLVLSSIGFYQVCPGCGGANEYILGMPQFAHAEISLPSRSTNIMTTLVIDVINDDSSTTTNTTTNTTSSPSTHDIPLRYIQSVRWNGCLYDCAFFPYEMLTSGTKGTVNHLVISVSDQPNTTWSREGRKCMTRYRYCPSSHWKEKAKDADENANVESSSSSSSSSIRNDFYSSFVLTRSLIEERKEQPSIDNTNNNDDIDLLPVCGCNK